MKKYVISILVLLIISGCASQYKVPASASTAEFSVEAYNDSKNITSRNLFVNVLSNENECETHPNGMRVGMDNGLPYHNRNFASLSPIRILASEPFRFVAQHTEPRFAKIGHCAVYAYFQPIEGRKYKAILNVKNNASKCDINILDITDGNEQLTEFVQPAFFPCGDRPLNGKGIIQNMPYK